MLLWDVTLCSLADYVNVMKEVALFILMTQDVCSGFIWNVGTHPLCYMASHPAVPQYWHSQQICQISRGKDHYTVPISRTMQY